MTHYKILSINGGGVRGLIPAKIIERITTIAKKPIHELFDYIVGTSAGGIIAVSLTVQDENGSPKYSATDIVKLFKEEAQIIFPPSYSDYIPGLRGLMQMFTPKHSRDGIDNLLTTKLGNATFLNTTMPITTISYSLDSDGPRLWSKYRAENDPDYHNYLLKDAAGATSAAPTFFPPKVTTAPTGELFRDIDGGVFANSPTMIGVTEFLKYHEVGSYLDKLTVLSIGTGRFKDDPIDSSTKDGIWPVGITTGITTGAITGGFLCTSIYRCFGGLSSPVKSAMCAVAGTTAVLTGTIVGAFIDAYNGAGGVGWIAKGALVEKMMKGAEVSDAFQSKIVKVLRINPVFDKEYSSMDDSSSLHIQRFEKEIDNFVKKHDTVLQKVVSCLESSGGQECRDAETHTAHFGEDFYAGVINTMYPIEF